MRIVLSRFSGPLLAAAAVGAVASVWSAPLAPFAGLCAWTAVLLRLRETVAMVRWTAAGLTSVGAVAMAYGLTRGVLPDWTAALSGNLQLIGLLIAVTFLQLVAFPGAPRERSTRRPGSGPKGFLRTGLAVLLFGAVINLSIVAMVLDHLARGRAIGRAELVLVTRFFTAGLFWSPFFGAMAASLIYSPDASLLILTPFGLILAGYGLALTWWTIGRRVADSFCGYPVDFRGLRVPAVLAVIVVAAHALWPDFPVLTLITVVAPVFSVAVLVLDQGGDGVRRLRVHISQRLPAMANELLLFLSAGIMAAGLGSALQVLNGWTPYTAYGPVEAWLTALGIIALSAFGVHPVVGVAVFGTLAAPLHPPMELQALAFLSAWGAASVGSPFSGLGLMMQGRYGIRPGQIVRWQWRYALSLWLATGPLLFLLDACMRLLRG